MKRLYLLLLIAFLLSAGMVGAQPSFEKSVANLRNQRYCEVLYGKRNFLRLEVKVFNTQGLNLCPEERWQALSKEAIAKQFDASLVVLNGPRYWMMDEIQASGATINNVKESFGGIEMNLRATVEIGLLKQILGDKRFTPNQINRTTNFVYKAGNPIYELISPAGEVYVMQSYSQIVNPSLSMKDLVVLGNQLNLPAGWQYQSRILERDLSLVANGVAYVLQDNLSNSYQRR
ncbi:MAG: hypothetical protein ACOYBT_01800 [Polynucleobacter sp.]